MRLFMFRTNWYVPRENLPRSIRFYSYELPKEDMFNLVYIGNYKAICSRIKKDLSVVNLRNDKDQTLLHYAVLYNQIKIAKLLISSGADLDAKDKFGQTVRDIIPNPELYGQLDETRNPLILQQTQQEIVESHVLGSSENDSCCVLM